MSKYTFYASVNKIFINSLKNEFKQLGIESESMINLNKQGLNYLKFTSDFQSIWKIFLYSRLVEGLKIQIAENIKAFDEKSLKVNIKRVEFDKYLPIRNSLEFKMPTVKAYSYRSKLYHEKMIENIVKTTLNKLAYNNKEDNEGKMKKLKLNTQIQEEELIKKLEERKNLKELPRIDVILQNDKAKILLNLLNKPLHMHGYKSKINWGSLRETTACALIYSSKIIDKLYDNKTLLVWDPFCGSGTIVIETFLLATERHIRPMNEISKEAFVNLPFHDKNEFHKFLETEKSTSEDSIIQFRRENTDLHLIASDIASKSIDAVSKNSQKAQLTKYTVNCADEILYSDSSFKFNLAINPTIYHEKINNIFNIFIGDFEIIAKEVIFNPKLPFHSKKFTIFSNIPYGTSPEMSDKIQIKSLYKRFGRFLRKHSHQFDDVFILVNSRDSKDELNFKNLTEIGWEVVSKFFNNGIECEFLKMRKN